jgi:uncharacterized membrane protein
LISSVLGRGLLAGAATTGVVAAGVVLFEAALVPGLVIGAAAVLAPQLLARRRSAAKSTAKANLRRLLPASLGDLAHIKFSRSVAKTITFRVIVTSLDFTGNYLVLGEPATAAGLSAINVVGGPLFYFIHETTWNYLVGSGKVDRIADNSALKFLTNRPLAKTITYRTFATIVEFATNYVVVRDLGTAALLSSFGFFLGPFVYYGHEFAWERFAPKSVDQRAPRKRRSNERAPVVIDVDPVPVG